ncbi:hypothetical protein Droror1_Dr00010686 [Drosera rotundifolia]
MHLHNRLLKHLRITTLFESHRPISSLPIPNPHSPSKHKPFFKSPTTTFNQPHHLQYPDKHFTETISTLCEQNRLNDAIQLLGQSNRVSATVYSTLLGLCIRLRALDGGKRVHEHMSGNGFVPGFFICNRLIDLYTKCESLEDARKVFDEMPERDLCSWNTMISGYAKAGRVEEARELFDSMEERDGFSWTAMTSGYVRGERPKEALDVFRLMRHCGNLECNKFTFSSVIAAAAAVMSLRLGREIHGHIVRVGLDSDSVVWSALSDMYGKCGSIREARHVFDMTEDKDVVSWTTMIDRYFEDGRREEGFALFADMMRSLRVKPNQFTFAGVLNACADQTAEDIGKQIHGHMLRVGFDPHSFAASALVHMYSKCGNMTDARKITNYMSRPEIVSWTSLIVGYAQNGEPVESLKLFDLLLQSGIRPDHVTFVGVLNACTHAGLVDEGLEHFLSLKEKHGLEHTREHYACLIDLLSRAGRFKDVEHYMDTMPMKPDKYMWASILGGCRIHKNVELAERAANALFEIEPENAATHATLANIYATAGRWDEVAKVRKIMDLKGAVKTPGLSWVCVKHRNHVFLVGDDSHPSYQEIIHYLKKISKEMREDGYVPDTNFVLHDIEEEQKEQNLTYHSEKLAVAYGIIATLPGTPIKVFKNLRTCVDCHTAIKFISRITQRTITVRDSNRFHCFKNGSCSCKDYW